MWATVEGWWASDPILTTFGLAFGAILAVLLLVAFAIAAFPSCRIVYRAFRRVLWTKIGTTRHGPPLPKRYREHLDQKKIQRLLMATEGAAFGRTGVIYLTPEEIGFAALRFGVMIENNVPYAQVMEAKISKGAIYDYVTVTTRERSETLRLYHSDRDVGQEFFNHLQMRLGAMRFR